MTITDDYLAAVSERGPRASELLAASQDDLAGTWYQTGYLSRPVFLGRQRFRQLVADLDVLVSTLTRVPDLIFGGDPAACARAVGLAEPQVQAILHSRGTPPSRLARADLYQHETGFELMEINFGSNLGGLDNAVLNDAMLEQPFIADFVARNELTYVDTMVELAHTLFDECKVPSGLRPFVAAVEWPGRWAELEDLLRRSTAALGPLGIDCEPCPIDQLTYTDDGVWLGEHRVDIVYRLFHLEDLLHPGMPEQVGQLLRAVERGQVSMFTPLDGDLYGSKGMLALLSDEQHRHLFTADEAASLERILPWTRPVRPGPVTVNGEHVDLADYVEANQNELVLKPPVEHGGQGVVLGWLTDPDTWRERLAEAMQRPYVVQRRIRPVLEMFPTDDGVEPWLLTWGAFTGSRGFSGFWMRGSRDLGGGVVNMQTGATAMCCFHQT